MVKQKDFIFRLAKLVFRKTVKFDVKSQSQVDFYKGIFDVEPFFSF